MKEQFPLIKEMLEAFRIRQFELAGYEADDIIGTLTRLADEKGQEVLVVTGDKDMLQLASDHVTVALTRKGISEVELYNPDAIRVKYDLNPAQIIDLKGLMGDPSDNIPGIPGVGEKTALKLLHEYGSVESVLDNVEQLKGKMKERVETHAEDARMSKKLATIYREVPVDLQLDELEFTGAKGQALAELFRKLEFKSLLEKNDFTGPEQVESAEEEVIEFIVADSSDIAALIQSLPEVQTIHVEAFGDNPHTASVHGVAFHYADKGYYVPLEVLQGAPAAPVRKWLADPACSKWMFDLHRAEVALSWEGIELKGVAFDVLLAAYLLDPTESTRTLNWLASKYGVPGLKQDEEVFGKGAKFKLPGISVTGEHMCRKAATIQHLVPLLQADLEKNEMNPLCYDLELPLAKVLADMERQGIKVNVEELKEFGKELSGKLDLIMASIYGLAGMEFNINSPKQLGEILFDKLGLPVVKKDENRLFHRCGGSGEA